MLAREAESIAQLLVPDGKKSGQEWRAGDIHGGSGKSFAVHLTGARAGVWADFATGEKGDLLDLWCAVRGVSIADALKQVREHLGLKDQQFTTSRVEYSKPKPIRSLQPTVESPVLRWLLRDRQLSDDAIKAYQITIDGEYVVFPSYRDGEMVRWKRRSYRDKHRCTTSSDCEPALFGWQAIPPEARSVVICEGELDAMAWWDMRYPGLSVPNGAKGLNWIDVEYDDLIRFDSIYLAMDADPAGQGSVMEIVDRLGRERVHVVDTDPYPDANDMLREFRDYADECIVNAKTIDPKELASVSEFRSKVVDIYSGQPSELVGEPLPWAAYADRFRFRSNEVTVIAGEAFHGKSELCGQISVDLMSRGHRACVASLEMIPVSWIVRIMQQIGCVPRGEASNQFADQIVDWLVDRLWAFTVTGRAKTKRILEVFEYARRRYGIWLFVIDNLSKCGIAEDDYDGQKGFVEELTDFAKDNRCHVILVHHLNKSEDEKPGTSYRVRGSAGIIDMTDNAIIHWRNRKKERLIEDHRLIGKEVPDKIKYQIDAQLIVEKQRDSGDTPKMSLYFDKRSHQYLPEIRSRPIEYLELTRREARQ